MCVFTEAARWAAVLGWVRAAPVCWLRECFQQGVGGSAGIHPEGP